MNDPSGESPQDVAATAHSFGDVSSPPIALDSGVATDGPMSQPQLTNIDGNNADLELQEPIHHLEIDLHQPVHDAVHVDYTHQHLTGGGYPVSLAEPLPPLLPHEPLHQMDPPNTFIKPDPYSSHYPEYIYNEEAVKKFNDVDAELDLADIESLHEQRISAFARLKFLDGSYYMTTHQIIIGRDMMQSREAMRRLSRMQKANARVERASDMSVRKKRKRTKKSSQTARSIVSESGGIVRVPLDSLPLEYRRKSEASQSASASSQHLTHGSAQSQQDELPEHAPQDVMMDSFPPVPRDLHQTVPDPDDCPYVYIHPQQVLAPGGPQGPKGISRQHAKIAYNADIAQFELTVLGSNGLFCQNVHYQKGAVIPLKNDDFILIGAVEIRFQLPNDPGDDEDVGSDDEVCSRPMSFAFENGRGESEDVVDSSEDEQEITEAHQLWQYANGYESDDVADDDEEEEEEEEEEDNDDEDELKATPEPRRQTVRLKINTRISPPNDKRKGNKKRGKVSRPLPPPPPKPLSKTKKEVSKDASKEKGKLPAKDLFKDKSKDKVKEPPKPSGKEEQPNQTEVKEKPKDQPKEGTTLTADDVARFGLPESMVGQIVQKRKGPGRPPKDGFMSKREKALIARQAKEAEKARRLGLDPADLPPIPSKVKPNRPRKDSNLEEDGEEGNVKESTEGQGDTADPSGTDAAGEKKPLKYTKPPRSPSPEMKITDYTEEQLQRPLINYVLMIHEAISSSKTGVMNLQQIYSAIERKYPYYKFRVPTNGWQSSVRHNLGQHEAFKKADKEGKGYNWRIDPDVSIDKERKRAKNSPPLQSQQHRQQYYPHPPGYPMMQPHGMPGAYYPSYPYPPSGQGHPADGAARVSAPANEDPSRPSVPRLPPSLARGNAPANVPAAPSASPYASPWAGGGGNDAGTKAAGNPPAQSSHTRPPYSAYPPSSSAPGGSYGMLVTTSAPYPYAHPAAQHPSHYPPASQSPYTNAPRTYSPHTLAGSTPNPSHTPYPPHPQPNNRNPPQPRYPSHITPAVAEQLDAFRDTFIARSTEDKAFAERKVNNAIKQVVSPSNPPPALIDAEQQLVLILQKIIDNDAARRAPQSHDQLKNDAPKDQEKASDSGPPAGRTLSELATSAATIAASDAAAAVADAKSAVTAPASEGQASSASQLPSTPQDAKPDPPFDTPVRSCSAPGKAKRPSVEPITPVPGSPMVGVVVVANGGATPTRMPTPAPAGRKRSFGGMADETGTRDGEMGPQDSEEGREVKRLAV
ncbi:hypothetical protein K432DRAFT_192922 [Lepidopterella palustris CBS 459.81]|uniref:Fork-head domain-containing protein n=1 Tax=Lepidopterella palustris CBS 459.81 TaxID=1314670 RepID=A0A8E2EFR9_9PEZI|nr:hypothetical protein K432DRAFT_192922 [Lepidopterella palustris CBS 459.81]